MMDVTRKYPKFNHPEKYLECREPKSLFPAIKGLLEKWIIRRLLRGIPDLRTICDAPSGPGRLFSLWSGMGCRVYGVDISPPMVQYAVMFHRRLGLQGGVIEGDAFKLAELLPETPDLVACIRFAYYFEHSDRVSLLQALSLASRRYVLVQYKTAETCKGRRNQARQLKHAKPGKSHLRWHFAARSAIEQELQLAGLLPLRITYVGPFSDRLFVLAEKQQP